jgi:hypothetical protein
VRRPVLEPGPPEHLQEPPLDHAEGLQGPLARIAVRVQFPGDVDQPAGVHDVVRRVEDAGREQHVAVAGLRELVVGGTGDDPASQLRDGRIVQHRTERAGGEHVGLDRMDLLRCRGFGAEAAHRFADAGLVDVGDHEPHPPFGHERRERHADMSEPLDRHTQAVEGLAAEGVPHRHLDALHHAEGGEGRGIAAAARAAAEHVAGLAAGLVHPGGRGAGVCAREVAPAHGLDGAAEGAEQGRRLVPRRIAEDHALAAAEGEPGHRRHEGHALREPQDVGERIPLARVRPHPAAADGRTEGCVVHRHDGPEAAVVVADETHLLVPVELRMAEQLHGPISRPLPNSSRCKDSRAGEESPSGSCRCEAGYGRIFPSGPPR